MTLLNVQLTYPFINDWVGYINAQLPDGIDVNENELVNIRVPLFTKNLGVLLDKTPKRVMANYMIWRLIADRLYNLNEELLSRALKYNKLLTGVDKQKPRWNVCATFINENLDKSIGALYVRKYFNDKSKRAVFEMVDYIRDTYEKILKSINWMDEKTREKAVDKLKAMFFHIGYPDELLDDNKLGKFYENLTIDPTKLFESILSLEKFNADNEYNKLRLPVNKTDWENHSSPANINAFYTRSENSIRKFMV